MTGVKGKIIRFRDVFARADQTDAMTYVFDDGERTAPAEEMNTEVIAKRIERANADLLIELTLLHDAENAVVKCQGDVAKASIRLENEQAALRNAIEARNLL